MDNYLDGHDYLFADYTSHNSFFLESELENIFKIMSGKQPFRILIQGSPGSGKTTLLYMIAKHIETHTFFNAHEIINNNHKKTYAWPREGCILIDGLDEVANHYDLAHAFSQFPSNQNIICTSRTSIFSYDTFFTDTVTISSQNMHDVFLKRFSHVISDVSGSNDPDTIRNIIKNITLNLDESSAHEFYKIFSKQLYRHNEGVSYCPEIIVSKKEIVVPPQEVITNLEVAEASILKRIKENGALIDKLTSREFEELVCEMLEKNDINAILTKQTRDGGKDIIVCENKLIGNFLIYVECKKYRKDRPVAVRFVRELFGTVEADKATAGLLITTSYFTNAAKEYTETIKHRMSLMDYTGLLQTISKTDN